MAKSSESLNVRASRARFFFLFLFRSLAASVIFSFSPYLRSNIPCKVREMKTSRAKRSHFHEGDCVSPRKAICMSFACVSAALPPG